MKLPKAGWLLPVVALLAAGIGYLAWQRLRAGDLPEGLASGNGRIEAVEFLSAARTGAGVRFRETRRAFGARAQTVLEVTEYDAPRRVRLVADSHGTVWDTLFEVRGDGENTRLRVTVHARSHKLLARMTNRVLTGLVKNNIAADLADIRRWCEGQVNGGQSASPRSG